MGSDVTKIEILVISDFTRETTNNYSRTKDHWENPRTWGESEASHCNTETKTICIRKVRGAAAHWLHCPFPRPVQHYRQMSPLSLQLFWWEYRTRGVEKTSIPQHCGLLSESHYYDLTSRGLQKNLQDSTTGNLTMTENGEGACNNQHTAPANPRSKLNQQFYSHTEQVSDEHWPRNLTGCRSVWFGSSNKEFC